VTISKDVSGAAAAKHRSTFLWQAAWLIAALAWAVPIGFSAYDQLTRVNDQARARLIEQHRLWELDPNFRGRPEIWTRLASRLLSDRQVLMRVAAKYGGQSEAIELEYRRDLTMARAEVVVIALAWWIAPVAALYGIAVMVRRRQRAPPPKVVPASVSDPRYRRPDQK
jgi:hypothetical protein